MRGFTLRGFAARGVVRAVGDDCLRWWGECNALSVLVEERLLLHLASYDNLASFLALGGSC